MLFWVGKHIYIHVCLYILCIAHPFCVCVCWWSDDLLSGSRWCDKWTRRCLDSERGLAGDILYIHILYVYYFSFENNM